MGATVAVVIERFMMVVLNGLMQCQIALTIGNGARLACRAGLALHLDPIVSNRSVLTR